MYVLFENYKRILRTLCKDYVWVREQREFPSSTSSCSPKGLGSHCNFPLLATFYGFGPGGVY